MILTYSLFLLSLIAALLLESQFLSSGGEGSAIGPVIFSISIHSVHTAARTYRAAFLL